jgi:hypothetical protein
MITLVKKLFGSKIFRLLFSIVLLYLAFSKVEMPNLLAEIAKVPIWFVVLMLLYFLAASMLGSYRWISLLFDKPSWRQTFDFLKAGYIGGFYGMFFPSGMAGDLFKWIPLQKKYGDIKKSKLFSSILLDRIIGFSAFIIVAFVSALIGLKIGIYFPMYLLYLFGGLFAGTILFYVLVFSLDVAKIISRIPFINKLSGLLELLKKENKNRLVKCFLIAVVTEFAWFTPIWFISQIIGAGMSLVQIYIVVPVVALVLLLPISIGGFGAREQIYLFFFSQMGLVADKILAVSTVSGILGILNVLIGGLFALFI